MPNPNNNSVQDKFITLGNLEHYNDYIYPEEMTQDEYQEIEPEAGKTYFITDYDAGQSADAEDVAYDNTDSELQADNVQDAIDESYAAIDTLSNVYAQFGIKNLNTYPYYTTTTTHRGITFTDNGDGSITVSGTNDGTGASFFDCHTRVVGENNSLKLPNGEYILSGCPSDNPNNSFYLTAQATINGTGVALGVDKGNGVLVELNGDDYSSDNVEIQIRIVVNKGIVISNPIIFYPMIRPATVEDATWEPYVKTNKQLTAELEDVETALATKADLTDLAPAFSTATAYTVGQYVSYDGNIYKCTSTHSAGAWVAGDFTLVAVGSELESKQPKTDNNLTTTSKDTTGAINELKSGLTNLTNDVHGTVYEIPKSGHVDVTVNKEYLYITNRDSEAYLSAGLLGRYWGGTPVVLPIVAGTGSLITVSAQSDNVVRFSSSGNVCWVRLIPLAFG